MRILHTADWHFGRTLEGRSRLQEQAAFVDELVALTEEERVDLVLIAGDVYDSVNPPAAAEQLFYEAAARLSDGGRRPIVIISGNHDHPERLSASAPLVGERGVFLIGQPTLEAVVVPCARTGEEAVIAALPYPSEARLGELLSDEAEEQAVRRAYSARVSQLLARQAQRFRPTAVNLAMSHLYVLGGAESDSERPIQVGGAYTVDPSAFACQGAPAAPQYTALGHLHRPQYVKGPGVIRYSGSPLAYSFSEAGQAKSVTLLDLAPGAEAVPEERYLSSGRPLAEWNARGGYEEVMRWIEEGRDSRAWLDVSLTLTEALTMDQIQKLRRAHDGIVHIRPVYAEAEREAEDEVRLSELPVQEMFRRFYERQTGGAQPDDALVACFLELIEPEAEEKEESA
ncbi:exonuclease SbcCD subunit D [Paenibacillus melissococcoides]|uniref:Nuclease SbcCD subunit D n=1 Tax=Paenibacillus melissococcoides TaxID=2912268 RepID=A0ABM9G0M9_9BACL|nr:MULTISPECIES: exonuclease SbcCD subunit D [Paenibacillus]GIO79766.1 nuclease SbcCD subunit D [Paenibacillus dendritiformis]CAH8245172.1 exonuclease SbcCD subunit D [Paenibacillus melissococcoides]CAH8710184.1 exonuclease SbcCD subunit D [Paenibacillus melissococcoides]CAH8710953.1 exonuclease SbcCD subunit D [Paenibacillus melissococcoides]